MTDLRMFYIAFNKKQFIATSSYITSNSTFSWHDLDSSGAFTIIQRDMQSVNLFYLF